MVNSVHDDHRKIGNGYYSKLRDVPKRNSIDDRYGTTYSDDEYYLYESISLWTVYYRRRKDLL